MLAAAHVLAMDAKNLLDVVDSVRIRHPELFLDVIDSSTDFNNLSTITPDKHLVQKTEEIPSIFPSYASFVNSSDSWIEEQSYENFSRKNEIYVNQEQIKPIEKEDEGIYDNSSIISQQKLLSTNTANMLNIDTKTQSSSSKPPIAVKVKGRIYNSVFFIVLK